MYLTVESMFLLPHTNSFLLTRTSSLIITISMQHNYRAVWIFTLECKSLHVGLQREPLKANYCKASQCTSQNLHQKTCRPTNSQRKRNTSFVHHLQDKTLINNSNFQLTCAVVGKLSIKLVEVLAWQTPMPCTENSQMGATSHYKYHKVLQLIWKFFGHLFFEEGFCQSKMTTVLKSIQWHSSHCTYNVGVIHLHTY